VNEKFTQFARQISHYVGTPWAFVAAFTTIIIWACMGPIFGWSDTHQLVINTTTTIITFLVVFLIQNTQNRETKAIQLKLDGLLKYIQDSRSNNLIQLEDLTDEQLERLRSVMSRAKHEDKR
jgi:low affinity Fe/Cu permease